MSAPQIIKTPGGEELVVLSRADCEALLPSDLESRRRAASAETVDRLALALDAPKAWIDG